MAGALGRVTPRGLLPSASPGARAVHPPWAGLRPCGPGAAATGGGVSVPVGGPGRRRPVGEGGARVAGGEPGWLGGGRSPVGGWAGAAARRGRRRGIQSEEAASRRASDGRAMGAGGRRQTTWNSTRATGGRRGTTGGDGGRRQSRRDGPRWPVGWGAGGRSTRHDRIYVGISLCGRLGREIYISGWPGSGSSCRTGEITCFDLFPSIRAEYWRAGGN